MSFNSKTLGFSPPPFPHPRHTMADCHLTPGGRLLASAFDTVCCGVVDKQSTVDGVLHQKWAELPQSSSLLLKSDSCTREHAELEVRT